MIRSIGSRPWAALVAVAMGIGLAACQYDDLDTRTFDVRYLRSYEVESLLAPYVFTDRAERPGMMSVSQNAVTVRETADNLAKIGRVLEEYDRPRPSVMLHFQIIEADGAAASDPAIAEVETELRRLFRFEGYDLVAEAQVGGVSETAFRQIVGADEVERQFIVQGGVSEVRTGGETTTITVDVGLEASWFGRILETSVTIPAGHSVVLGTASVPSFDGALILVVRAELMDSTAG